MSDDEMLDERSEPYVEPQTEPTPRLLREMIVRHRRDAESGHRRHTEQLRRLEACITAAEAGVAKNDERIARIDEMLKRPVEATAIRYDFKTVVALVSLCGAIVGGQKWSTNGLEQKMTEQNGQIALVNAKMDAIKQHAEDVQKLQDARAESVTREMSRLGGQATMIDTKINNLMSKR